VLLQTKAAAANVFAFAESAVYDEELSQWSNFIDGGRDLRELSTRFRFPYAYDPQLGTTEQAFRQIVIANHVTSDVTIAAATIDTARDKFGARDNGATYFYTIQDETTAEDIGGYYVQESIAHQRRVYLIQDVPHHQAYKLQRGDLLRIVPHWIALHRPDMVDSDAPHPLVGEASDFLTFGAGSISDETSPNRWGGGHMRYTSDTNTTNPKLCYTESEVGIDLRRRHIRAFIYVTSANRANLSGSAGAAFRFGISSTPGTTPFLGGDNYSIFGVDKADITADVWNEFTFDVENDTPNLTGSSPVDPSRVFAWCVGFTQATPGTNNMQMGFSSLEVFNPRITVRVIETEKDFASNLVRVRCVEVLTT